MKKLKIRLQLGRRRTKERFIDGFDVCHYFVCDAHVFVFNTNHSTNQHDQNSSHHPSDAPLPPHSPSQMQTASGSGFSPDTSIAHARRHDPPCLPLFRIPTNPWIAHLVFDSVTKVGERQNVPMLDHICLSSINGHISTPLHQFRSLHLLTWHR